MALDIEKIEKIISEEADPVYKALAIKLGEPECKHMPHMMARLATVQQAKIMDMVESPMEEISAALGIDEETITKELQIMFERGLMHRGRTGWHLNRSWRAARDSVAGSHAKYNDDLFFDLVAHKELLQRNEVINQVKRGEVEKVRQGMRVVPRWESIKDIEGVMPCEDVREIVKQTPIAILGCPCKKIERHRDCKDEIPVESCIVFARSAQHNLNRGSARELTHDEVMAIIESLDKHQLVHMTGNSTVLPPLLCNCHACCCGALMRNRLAKNELDQFAIVPSRFIAQEDPETCNGCRTCADTRCPVDAIEIKFDSKLNKERAYTNPDDCIGCGLCALTCPTDSRSMKLVRPPEHIPKPGGRPEEYATY